MGFLMRGTLFRYLVLTSNVVLAATALVILPLEICTRNAAAAEEQTCDITGDSALRFEEYPAAIALHRSYLRSHPDNAIAHYHLGFAYGMTGRSSQEISEYLKATGLGLREWDLFLDLGLAYLNQREYSNAVEALETSVSLGAEHPETHFNLALAYEKAGRLSDAMRETIASLRLAPWDPDARNTKAIICAELGDLSCASDEWKLLTEIVPNYAPARTNLAILTGSAAESPDSAPDTAEIPQLVASHTWATGR